MRIREALPRDAARMVELFTQLGYATQADQLVHCLCELQGQGQDGACALVAEDGAMVVGVAVVHVMAPLHVAQPWALLSSLVVDEGHRGAGVGEALLAAAEAFAAQRGCSQLELSSSLARTRAHAFYERQGYREKRVRFVKTLP